MSGTAPLYLDLGAAADAGILKGSPFRNEVVEGSFLFKNRMEMLDIFCEKKL